MLLAVIMKRMLLAVIMFCLTFSLTVSADEYYEPEPTWEENPAFYGDFNGDGYNDDDEPEPTWEENPAFYGDFDGDGYNDDDPEMNMYDGTPGGGYEAPAAATTYLYTDDVYAMYEEEFEQYLIEMQTETNIMPPVYQSPEWYSMFDEFITDKMEGTDEADEEPAYDEESRTYTAFELYDALQENETLPFELNDKATDFLIEYDDLFPCEDLDDINTELIDDTIDSRQIKKKKNKKKFGDKLFSMPRLYVTQIQEEDLGDGTYLTEINAVEEYGEQSYYILYYGMLEDVYESDVIFAVGLPLGSGSYENAEGGKTRTIVVAGSYVELAE